MHRSNFPFMRGWGGDRVPNCKQAKFAYEGVGGRVLNFGKTKFANEGVGDSGNGGGGRVPFLVKSNLHMGEGEGAADNLRSEFRSNPINPYPLSTHPLPHPHGRGWGEGGLLFFFSGRG